MGIDTTHFLGQAHRRGVPNSGRRRPDEVLVLRSADRHRAAPQRLRRALIEIGRPYLCEVCGIDGSWNGARLVLHVDHIDGRFHDCRPDNLRFLCPNCHSQTSTYAGRNRRPNGSSTVRTDEHGSAVDSAVVRQVLTDEKRVALIGRVEAGELGPSEAARLLGCHRNHLYRLRRRLAESGSLLPSPRSPQAAARHRDAVLAFATAHPSLGPRKIAAALRNSSEQSIHISHGTVTNILRAAQLATTAARAKAASTFWLTQGSV
jgi:5-methylcytosine-specific restriction endonuclease McrA